eukprot:345774_1
MICTRIMQRNPETVFVHSLIDLFTICLRSVWIVGIPLAIKESVRLKFENVSLPHPSLTVIARDCNGTIMYDEKGDKQRIGKRLFTMNINDIFEEWMDEQRDLIIDYLYARNKKCICYGYFCRLRPCNVLKCKYISLMACDTCTELNYMKQAIDKALRQNHICLGDMCAICILINYSNSELLNGSCL